MIRRSDCPLRGALLMATVLAVAGCGQKVGPAKVEVKPGVPVPEGTAFHEVKRESVRPRIDLVGTAVSEKTIRLSARISAYVNEVFASAGSKVKAGATLLALDDREIREQLAGAEAALKQAESEHRRVQRLLESKAATEQQFTASEAAFRAAQARMEGLKVMQSYATIVSPIDGVVTEREVDAGDLANPGQPLLTIFDPMRMRLEVPVPVRLVEKLSLGKEVEVTMDHPAVTLKGEITEIVSEIDARSRTRKVKVHLPHSAEDILPGAFGRLWVEDKPREATLVPSGAVQRVGQLEIVQVAENGRLLRRLVKTGPRAGDWVEILSGLNPGERIAIPAPAGG
jgi:membrane fusion protein, multidrug efflux system